MGLMGVATSTGMAIGPALGGFIGKTGETWMVFVAGGLMALASILVIKNIKETLPNPQPFSFKLLKINKEDVFEPRVWLPSLVMLLVVVPFGVILTVIPDFSDHLGLENRGSFFSYYVAASLIIRFFIGRFSDKFGREIFAMFGTGILGLALLLIPNATDYTSLMMAAVVFGVGSGINSPTIFAWTTDLSLPEKRGRGLSTMYMALELGIGFGGYFGAELHANSAENFQRAFTIPAYFAFTATTIVAASMLYKLIKK
jgi:MFS family permease